MSSISDLNQQLKSIKLKQNEKAELQKLITSKELVYEKEKEELKAAGKQLDKELEEVKELERNKVKNIFLTVMSKKDEIIAKENGELKQAEALYEKERKEFVDAEGELDELYQTLSSYQDIEEEYNSIINQKMHIILNYRDDNAKYLDDINIKLNICKEELNQVNNHILNAEKVKKSLSGMLSDLKTARNYSNKEAELFSKYHNHDNHSFKKKKENIVDAKKHLDLLTCQLETLKNTVPGEFDEINIEFDISQVVLFFSSIFDHTFSDRIIHGKIATALFQAENAFNRINLFIANKTEEAANIEKRLSVIKAEFTGFIEKFE